jgi:hypothetical protein
METLKGLAWLLLCQSAGEALARLTGLGLPGPVIGMLILLGALNWEVVRRPVSAAADTLLAHLSLLFVPVCSAHCVRARRTRPAGDLLSFAGSNESRQSKEPEYDLVRTTCKRVRPVQVEAGSARRLDLARLWKLNTLRVRVRFSSLWLSQPLLGERCAWLSQQPPRVCCHVSETNRIQAFCFGYFHLGQQMKVTAGRAHRRALTQ